MKKIALLILLVLMGIQFIRPDKNESGYESLVNFEQETQMPSHIKGIMQKNCYDCHSRQTTYPWYAEITPISHWLDHHIKEGKEHLDLTQWGTWNYQIKDHKLDELIEEVEEGEMPLDSYTWIHGSLNDAEKELLINWAKNVRTSLKTKLANTP